MKRSTITHWAPRNNFGWFFYLGDRIIIHERFLILPQKLQHTNLQGSTMQFEPNDIGDDNKLGKVIRKGKILTHDRNCDKRGNPSTGGR